MDKNKLRRPSVVLGMNLDDYKQNLLGGIDGVAYWTPKGLVRDDKINVKVILVFIDFKESIFNKHE